MHAMQLHMWKRWTYTDRGAKLINYWGGKLSITFTGLMTHIRKEIPSITSIGYRPTYERKYRQLPQWGNDQHTKGNTVNYLNGVTTNIRKEIPSITSMGQRPTYERKYRQLPQWGNDQHTKGNTVNYLNGVTTNIRTEIPSITSMG